MSEHMTADDHAAATAPLVLVAYASKNGGTAEIAWWIGETLTAEGVDAQVRTAREVDDLSCYSAVVLGSGVYAGRWLREAVRFARRHRDPLRRVPVWLFSSGPLDPSAREGDLPAVPGAVKVGDLVDAREHRTFGGRLVPGARGFMARMILRQGRGGDYRDRERITAWARDLAREAVSSPRRL